MGLQKFLDLTYWRRYTTFVEMEDTLDEQDRGDSVLFLGGYENILLWHGLSKELCKEIEEAIASGLLVPHPTSLITYMIDGCHLNLPLAKQLRKYKEPHWLPVCFEPGPKLIEEIRDLSKEESLRRWEAIEGTRQF